MWFTSVALATLGAIAQFTQVNKAYNFYYKGISCRCAGDYRGAIANYTQAIHLDPEFAEAYYSRGNTQFELHNYEQAIQDYTQAIQYNPACADAYYNRGNTLVLIGKQQEALADYSTALNLNHRDADIYGNRGYIHLLLNNRRGAVEDLQQALQLLSEQPQSKKYQLVQRLLERLLQPMSINTQSLGQFPWIEEYSISNR